MLVIQENKRRAIAAAMAGLIIFAGGIAIGLALGSSHASIARAADTTGYWQARATQLRRSLTREQASARRRRATTNLERIAIARDRRSLLAARHCARVRRPGKCLKRAGL